jgi:hypothetical protein
LVAAYLGRAEDEPAADAHDLRDNEALFAESLLPDSHVENQALAPDLRAGGSDGIACPSRTQEDSQYVAMFYPDLASNPVQGRQPDDHWDGARVDFYREVGNGAVYRIQGGVR